MTRQIKKRISDLEKKTNPEGDQVRVIVDWGDDPELPKDDNVTVITWGEDDNIETA